ncbi:Ig-like domain-containing protein [Candidatus Poribacteria bacterium]|nr:Ig-like domain-containing protein [Candidatus Poribacteria bacterium]
MVYRVISTRCGVISLFLLLGFLSWNFASAQEDDVPPRILYTNPSDGATNASIKINFWIQFSEPMDQDSVLRTTVDLEDLTTGQKLANTSLRNLVDGGFLRASFNDAGDKLTLTSDISLSPGHTYRITLKNIVATDLAGNRLSIDKTQFTFRTRGTVSEVSGIISESKTWSEDVILIKNNMLVMEGAVLTINPGVEVIFEGSYNIVIEGKLIANGTSDNYIIFTSSGARWGNIKFSKGSEGSFS